MTDLADPERAEEEAQTWTREREEEEERRSSRRRGSES